MQTAKLRNRGLRHRCVSDLAELLPIIGTVLADADFSPHKHPTHEVVSAMRNVWFFCVVYDFVSVSVDNAPLHKAINGLASKTPQLVMDTATNYLESDLEYNSVMRRGITDTDTVFLRSSLVEKIPENSSFIRYLAPAQTTFLLSIYHIEILRAKNGDCTYVFRYLENQGISSSTLVDIIEAIIYKVNSAFIQSKKSQRVAKAIGGDIEEQTRVLLHYCCHKLRRVHVISSRCFEKIVRSFPRVICNRKHIFLMFELVQLLWQSCEDEFQNEYSPTYKFTSKKGGITIWLPDDYSYRHHILEDFRNNVKTWLGLISPVNAGELGCLLLEYLAEEAPSEDFHMGRTLALEIARSLWPLKDWEPLPFAPSLRVDNSSKFLFVLSHVKYFQGEASGQEHADMSLRDSPGKTGAEAVLAGFDALSDKARGGGRFNAGEAKVWLYRGMQFLATNSHINRELLHRLVWLPTRLFVSEIIEIARSCWLVLVTRRPDLEILLLSELQNAWLWSIRERKGMFSASLKSQDPFVDEIKYSPTDNELISQIKIKENRSVYPHVMLIQFLASRLEFSLHSQPQVCLVIWRILTMTIGQKGLLSASSLTRPFRFLLFQMGLRFLEFLPEQNAATLDFQRSLFEFIFDWFRLPLDWCALSNKKSAFIELRILEHIYAALERYDSGGAPSEKTETLLHPQTTSDHSAASMQEKEEKQIRSWLKNATTLLKLFIENEFGRLHTWFFPTSNGSLSKSGFLVTKMEKSISDECWRHITMFAWEVQPALAVRLLTRFTVPGVRTVLRELVRQMPEMVAHVPDALPLLLESEPVLQMQQLRCLLYWAPVVPVTALMYFAPGKRAKPLLLQYAMKTLDHYEIKSVFFYVPQIVQALRHDDFGYLEKYITKAAKMSQLFAHQIIWNMKANSYRDEDGKQPDPLKPTLDRIIGKIVGSLSGEDKSFYEREFQFFNLVTGISGKLKPFIKKTKLEKKKKIDEELRLIKVDMGVYLPSNPDGEVIDIDYDSGRPLQSHAKAPFMATFKIRRKVLQFEQEPEDGGLSEADGCLKEKRVEVWQSAIFKVGDDCRQDLLALQLIALFKNIFFSAGLKLYVYPYRVIATAPGCGVIDVIPNSISRDQLGREKVNSYFDYFVAKYGGEESVEFQRARTNFVQSMAAYSVISYLLQIKDRHNGNIMLDDQGHIIHIDFGFILDISPGGINFENSPFKLTSEMIQVMGGSDGQPYRWFEDLCVKAYLATRPFAEQIVQTVALMLDSGLPCFRGEMTIKRLRARFQLDKSQRAAASFMVERIRESFENRRTVWYDSFQKATNGIPY